MTTPTRRRHKKRRPFSTPDKPQITKVQQTVRIAKLGRQGDGISATEPDNKAYSVFVPFTLTGEKVTILSDGKRGDVLEIIEPSPNRIQPICPYFERCGGCSMQHLENKKYQTWKLDAIRTAFKHQGIKYTSNPEFENSPKIDFIDAHGDGRRRVTLHIRFTKGRILAGFMQARSRQLIDIEDCPILAPRLKNTPDIARGLAAPFASSKQKLDIQFTATPEGLDCDIQGAGNISPKTHIVLSECVQKHQLARLTIDGDTTLERRKPMMPMGSALVPLPPSSFLQATELGENTLASLVLKGVGKAKKVADLFCGIGPFALRLATQSQVYAADSNIAMIDALKMATRFAKGLKPIKADARDLFRDPIYQDDLNAFNAIVINPARAGAHAQIQEIAASTVATVVYVSCDPKSLARDADILIQSGYQITQITAVDQFKYSNHVETVTVFKR